MTNLDSYKLLFNNLWMLDKQKLQKLNPDLVEHCEWRLLAPKSELSTNKNSQYENQSMLKNNTLSLSANVVSVDLTHTTNESVFYNQTLEIKAQVTDLQLGGLKPATTDKIANPILNQTTSSQVIPSMTPDFKAKSISSEVYAGIPSQLPLIDNWDELAIAATNCTKCKLCTGRKNVVIERGSRKARWLFVGEGPGEQEDIQGKPFVGASGQLLNKMIQAMKLNPETDVYICNVVKCRPPYNRNPEPDEIEACKSYLFSQINLVQPDIIITLGRFASQTILNSNIATGRLRGIIHHLDAIPVVVTYHPSYLLRTPSAKADAWEDLQLAMRAFADLPQIKEHKE